MTTKIITDKLEYIGSHISQMMGDDCANEAVILSTYLSSLGVLKAQKKQKAYQEAFDAINFDKSAAESEVIMKRSEAYKEYQTVEALFEATKECCHALKLKVRSLTEEQKTI